MFARSDVKAFLNEPPPVVLGSNLGSNSTSRKPGELSIASFAETLDSGNRQNLDLAASAAALGGARRMGGIGMDNSSCLDDRPLVHFGQAKGLAIGRTFIVRSILLTIGM